ncbi:hypothetical protein NPIL_355081, partial [Nephila pilipes]
VANVPRNENYDDHRWVRREVEVGKPDCPLRISPLSEDEF